MIEENIDRSTKYSRKAYFKQKTPETLDTLKFIQGELFTTIDKKIHDNYFEDSYKDNGYNDKFVWLFGVHGTYYNTYGSLGVHSSRISKKTKKRDKIEFIFDLAVNTPHEKVHKELVTLVNELAEMVDNYKSPKN